MLRLGLLMLACLLVALAGCADDTDELRAKIAEVKARLGMACSALAPTCYSGRAAPLLSSDQSSNREVNRCK